MRGKVLFYKGEANLDQLHCCSVETKLNKKQLTKFQLFLIHLCYAVVQLCCCFAVSGCLGHAVIFHKIIGGKTNDPKHLVTEQLWL